MDRKVDPDVHAAAEPTALLEAVLAGHAEVVQGLLAAGAKTDLADAHGETPLLAAASQREGDVNARNADGDTALIAAGRMGNKPGAMVLRAGGASTVLRNSKRATAADVARDRGFGDWAELMGGNG